MSKKEKKTLAGSFEDVGGNAQQQESKQNNNIDIDNDSVMDKIVRKKTSKEDTHTFRGFYIENEVVEALDGFTHDKPKGVKSELVNQLLRSYLKSEGRL